METDRKEIDLLQVVRFVIRNKFTFAVCFFLSNVVGFGIYLLKERPSPDYVTEYIIVNDVPPGSNPDNMIQKLNSIIKIPSVLEQFLGLIILPKNGSSESASTSSIINGIVGRQIAGQNVLEFTKTLSDEVYKFSITLPIRGIINHPNDLTANLNVVLANYNHSLSSRDSQRRNIAQARIDALQTQAQSSSAKLSEAVSSFQQKSLNLDRDLLDLQAKLLELPLRMPSVASSVPPTYTNDGGLVTRQRRIEWIFDLITLAQSQGKLSKSEQDNWLKLIASIRTQAQILDAEFRQSTMVIEAVSSGIKTQIQNLLDASQQDLTPMPVLRNGWGSRFINYETPVPPPGKTPPDPFRILIICAVIGLMAGVIISIGSIVFQNLKKETLDDKAPTNAMRDRRVVEQAS